MRLLVYGFAVCFNLSSTHPIFQCQVSNMCTSSTSQCHIATDNCHVCVNKQANWRSHNHRQQPSVRPILRSLACLLARWFVYVPKLVKGRVIYKRNKKPKHDIHSSVWKGKLWQKAVNCTGTSTRFVGNVRQGAAGRTGRSKEALARERYTRRTQRII